LQPFRFLGEKAESLKKKKNFLLNRKGALRKSKGKRAEFS